MLGESMGLSQLLLEAKAMRLQYYLKTGEGEDSERSKAWLIHFLNQVGNLEKSLALKKIQVPSGWGFTGRPGEGGRDKKTCSNSTLELLDGALDLKLGVFCCIWSLIQLS